MENEVFDSVLKSEIDKKNKTRTIGIVFFIVLILLFIAASMFFLYKTEFALLAGDLEIEDAVAIMNKLDEKKLEYKLNSDHSQIFIDKSHIDEIKLDLIKDGVVSGKNSGFELFDNTEIGMTEYSQKINFQRALQGELENTISSLREIKKCRVHLVMSNPRLFSKDDELAKASVSIFLEEGVTLAINKVKGIQNLVASSVPELTMDNVVVIDEEGRLLSQHFNEDEAGLSPAYLDTKKMIENYLRGKVDQLLIRALGPDNATVMVDATLQMDKVSAKIIEVIPVDKENNLGFLLKKKEKHEMSNSSVVTDEFSGINDEPDIPYDVEEEVEYSYGKIVEDVNTPPGQIIRLSVAIITSIVLPENEINKIKDVVSMAVGLDANRGDSIAVYSINHQSNQLHPQNPFQFTSLKMSQFMDDGLIQKKSFPEINNIEINSNKNNESILSSLKNFLKFNDKYRLLVYLMLFFSFCLFSFFLIRIIAINSVKNSILTDKDKKIILEKIQSWSTESA